MSSKIGRAGCTVIGLTLLGAVLSGCSSAELDTSTRSESGNITDAGEVGVFKLQVGDCLPASAVGEAPEPSESGLVKREEVDSMAALPCDQPHVGEVVSVDDNFFASDSEMPSDEEVAQRSDEACVSAIEAYTGEEYGTSPYGSYVLMPTSVSWSGGDRGIVCVALSFGEDLVEYEERTGSAKA